jgi:hypothetical protein
LPPSHLVRKLERRAPGPRAAILSLRPDRHYQDSSSARTPPTRPVATQFPSPCPRSSAGPMLPARKLKKRNVLICEAAEWPRGRSNPALDAAVGMWDTTSPRAPAAIREDGAIDRRDDASYEGILRAVIPSLWSRPDVFRPDFHAASAVIISCRIGAFGYFDGSQAVSPPQGRALSGKRREAFPLD